MMADAAPDRPRSGVGFRIPLFWRFSGLVTTRRSLAVAVCVIFASIADGIGIATLLPLISVMGDGASRPSAASRAVLQVLQVLHLPANPMLLVGIIAGGVLTKAVLMIVALRQIGGAVADVSSRLRLGLVESLLLARWSYYVRAPVGHFGNALGNDANAAGEAYNAALQLLSQLVQAVIYLTIAALVSWRLALFTLAVSAMMLGSLNGFLMASKRHAKAQQKLLHSILGRLTDVLIGIKPIKAMARQARFATLFAQDLRAVRKASRRQVFSRQINKSLQEPILAICLALGIIVALRVLGLTLSEVLVMSLLMAKAVMVIGRAQQEMQTFVGAQHGLMAMRAIVDRTVAERERVAGTVVPAFVADLEFRDVSFGFGPQPTLSGLNLKLAAGELVAVTGPSGAGKTTLIDLLLGFHRPQRGEICVDGVALAEIDLLLWRSLIGYVPQELVLFHDTIAANITLGEPGYGDDDVRRALAQAGALDFVSRLPLGIATVAGERGALLSGGQRQRIALARALVHRPRLLILDEATSALDPETEQLIIDNVQRLVREGGTTVISVTHHPAWLRVASRVVRLEGPATAHVAA